MQCMHQFNSIPNHTMSHTILLQIARRIEISQWNAMAIVVVVVVGWRVVGVLWMAEDGFCVGVEVTTLLSH